MKTIKIIILVCLFALLLVESSFSGKFVAEDPVNIVAWQVAYDYRETNPPYYYPGNMTGGDTMFVGSEGISGGYFILVALINPNLGGSCLTQHSQIKEVKAEWLGEPRYEFSLIPDTCFNQFLGHPTFTQTQAWSLLLRPVPWYFEGSWEFTLIYDCLTDGKQHKQTLEVQPNPPNTIPVKPSGILIEKEGNYFNVSWTMMGTASYLNYRVVVYNDEDNCPIAFFNANNADPSFIEFGAHRVKIKVPTIYAGKTIRIENRNSSGIPTPLPNTLGGGPNRALIRTRLPN